jgi:hypothetical protein
LLLWRLRSGGITDKSHHKQIVHEAPSPKNNQRKIDWRCGSSTGALSSNLSPSKKKETERERKKQREREREREKRQREKRDREREGREGGVSERGREGRREEERKRKKESRFLKCFNFTPNSIPCSHLS